jgi:predicted phage tail protein
MSDQHYRVHTGGDDLALEEIHNPASGEIKIVPVIAGAGATGRIILGVALVAFAIAFAPVGAGFLGAGLAAGGSTFTLGAAASAAIGLIGVSLVLSGVAQLLTPTPKTNTQDEGDPRKSFSFSGVQNTSRAGLPVPVVYGEMLVGSVVVSAGVDIVQVAA